VGRLCGRRLRCLKGDGEVLRSDEDDRQQTTDDGDAAGHDEDLVERVRVGAALAQPVADAVVEAGSED
jgi:hypothetical protein